MRSGDVQRRTPLDHPAFSDRRRGRPAPAIRGAGVRTDRVEAVGNRVLAPLASVDDVADFVASSAKISADMTPDEWLNSPGVAKHPGSEPFQKECGQCHKIEGYTEGGMRDAPGLFAWASPQWITRMIRKPGAPDLYGYFEGKDQMPPFGPEQLTDNDVAMVIRFLRNDYPMPDRPEGNSALVASGE